MSPGGSHLILPITQPREGPACCTTATLHVVIIAVVGSSHLCIVLVGKAALGKGRIAIIENRHQGGFIVGDIQRIAATGVAAGDGRHGYRLRAIGIAVVDCRNVKRDATLTIQDRDPGRDSRLARIVAGELNHQIATRIGPRYRRSRGRCTRILRDRCIGNVQGEHKRDIIIRHIQRVASTGKATGRCGDRDRLCAIHITVVHCRNIKRSTALTVRNRGRGRYGCFARIIARQTYHQIARGGTRAANRSSRRPGTCRFYDRVIRDGDAKQATTAHGSNRQTAQTQIIRNRVGRHCDFNFTRHIGNDRLGK